jgi:hypothetical protein
VSAHLLRPSLYFFNPLFQKLSFKKEKDRFEAFERLFATPLKAIYIPKERLSEFLATAMEVIRPLIRNRRTGKRSIYMVFAATFVDDDALTARAQQSLVFKSCLPNLWLRLA